jgi:hypothetical protein
MSLLPGVRDLRTPLASGYIWLCSFWVTAISLGWRLPTERPTTGGMAQHVWDLVSLIGPVPSLAILSFVAYVVGSFLEISTEWSVIQLAGRRVRRPYPPVTYVAFDVDDEPLASTIRSLNSRAHNSLGPRALRDLNSHIDSTEKLGAESPERHQAPDRVVVINAIIDEIPQLVTRLLVKNAELYERHDRLLAEAAFRVNIAIPLFGLLSAVALNLGLNASLELILQMAAVAVCGHLLRQGAMRAVRARDVVIQALTISELELESRQLKEWIDNRPEMNDRIAQKRAPRLVNRLGRAFTRFRILRSAMILFGLGFGGAIYYRILQEATGVLAWTLAILGAGLVAYPVIRLFWMRSIGRRQLERRLWADDDEPGRLLR